MQVFVFQSDEDVEVFCFTAEADKERLPRVFSPWRHKGQQELSAFSNPAIAGPAGHILAEIRAKGFYIGRTDRSEERASRRQRPA